jgi:beta-phosphoglucomutase-like phosphatase (HAD superfamily)
MVSRFASLTALPPIEPLNIPGRRSAERGGGRKAQDFVHCRKPDPGIYRIALDIAAVKPEEVVYIEDRPMFVEVAQGLGIRSICHSSYAATRGALADLGLAATSSPVAAAAGRSG